MGGVGAEVSSRRQGEGEGDMGAGREGQGGGGAVLCMRHVSDEGGAHCGGRGSAGG